MMSNAITDIFQPVGSVLSVCVHHTYRMHGFSTAAAVVAIKQSELTFGKPDDRASWQHHLKSIF